jgi:ATP-binding cassette subfamily B protein
VKKTKDSIYQFWSTTKWVFSHYFSYAPVLTSVYIVAELILNLSNIFNAYVIGLVTDGAIRIYTNHDISSKTLTPLIVILIGSYLIVELIKECDRYVWRLIGYQDRMRLRRLLNKRMAELDMSQLENPEVANKSQRFLEEIDNITNYLQMSVAMFGGIISFVTAAIVLTRSIPVAMVVYSIIMLYQVLVDQKFIRETWLLSKNTTEERRKYVANSNFLSDSNTLKELKITQGNTYLVKKFDEYFVWILEKFKDLRKRWLYWSFTNNLVDSGGFAFGILLIFKRLASGLISVGTLTFEIRALRIYADSFSSLVSNFVSIRESAIRLIDVRELFTKYNSDIDGEQMLTSGETPKIEFKNINFSYPNSKRKILRDINIEIKPGERITIVGENGAGKTTLVKLLSRLYKSIDGEILIDGINLNDIKSASWYQKLGVLFQDFNMYGHLSVKENIEIGNPDSLPNEDKIIQALSSADALNFVENYPAKLQQILSEKYKKGIRPSSGQWQKLAIARFFYRNSPVLILDEPTASIDAVAEAQIFDNIYKFIKGKTVIIISHRFSTVRNADRILVLDKGKIIEDGSHEELLKKGGKYAKAFELQAKGYN